MDLYCFKVAIVLFFKMLGRFLSAHHKGDHKSWAAQKRNESVLQSPVDLKLGFVLAGSKKIRINFDRGGRCNNFSQVLAPLKEESRVATKQQEQIELLRP